MSLRISVILSTYNGEEYIIEQLETLRNQTRHPDEVIICDDCSSDNTYSLEKKYIENNKLDKWQLFRNTTNKGWKRNFIELIEYASGDLIFPCDQDDHWHSSKLETMENLMETNERINVLVSYYEEVYVDGKRNIYPRKSDNSLHRIPIKKRFMNVEYPGCVYCLRATFAKLCNKYWKPSIPHDSLYWRLGMFDQSLYVIGTPLISQRKHADSTFAKEAKASHNIPSKLEEVSYTYDMINSIRSFIIDTGVLNKESACILERALKWNELRFLYLTTGKTIYWIKLLIYLSYYQTIKRYFLDLYIVLFNRNGHNKKQ